MSVEESVRLLLLSSVVLLVFSVGLQSRWGDVIYARRQPDLFWRGFAAVNLIVPAAAVILCLMVPIALSMKFAIVLMAVSPPAPFAPVKMLKTGSDTAFVSGLYIVLILSAIILVPLTIEILNDISPQRVDVPAIRLAVFILSTMVLPLIAGVAIASRWTVFAEKTAPIARFSAFGILIPIALLIVYDKIQAVAALVGDGTVLTMAAVICTAIAAGHFLGGRKAEHRAALAQVAATRHPGYAAIIVQRNFDDPHITAGIALFLLISMAISTGYAFWERKAYKRDQAAKAK